MEPQEPEKESLLDKVKDFIDQDKDGKVSDDLLRIGGAAAGAAVGFVVGAAGGPAGSVAGSVAGAYIGAKAGEVGTNIMDEKEAKASAPPEIEQK
jgi:phage tail tape-measure protein